MPDLRTHYLGLELKNPLVPSSSPLSRSVDSAKQLEDAGASAIVMYSLFEEELTQQDEVMNRFLLDGGIGSAEADSYLPFHADYQRGLDQYLEQLRKLKEALEIPVIASLNGVSLNGWVEHGIELQQCGADALELNAYYIAANMSDSANKVESRYLELVRELRNHVHLPITMKLSPQFSAIPNLVSELRQAGVNGVSLFNRFYQPDIDVEELRVVPRLNFSRSDDALLAMHWIAILHGHVQLSLAATGGVHTGEDAAKVLLAGADIAHMCSSLLIHGPRHLSTVLLDLQAWMERHEFESIDAFKGRFSQKHSNDPAAFERASYVWLLDNYSSPSGVRR